MSFRPTEADTRANYIDPALNQTGWAGPSLVWREYYYTDGMKLIGDKRGKRNKVDYLLRYNNANLAIIEAKKETEQPTTGLQQAISYAQDLGVSLVYSTNGLKIYEFDLTTGKGDYIAEYPTASNLYNRLHGSHEVRAKLHKEPYLLTGSMKPRYYQENAIRRVMEALSEGKKRILLTMATGVGKTFVSFQIVHKLLQAKWNNDGEDRKPRVLFLADRNILADQAINTFNHYEKDLVKINGEEIRRRDGVVPTNAYIFFAIYQAISERENIGGYYKQYPSDFFDLVIIDECHRGSANEDGSWRAILDHFSPAVHLGLTATPKRDDNVDTYEYFGLPVYQYSLKQGIQDGFLTPYKVKRVKTSVDEIILTSDDKIIDGEVERVDYTIPDFNKIIVVPERTELIAKTILEQINTMDKTIIFCVDQSHALLMRDKINKHKAVSDPTYCVRVTSDEGQVGRRLLERFQDNDKDIPVILTSSMMLTTGVDARNVRNIVLVRGINSMVEFKQIIGRGTRVFDGKDFFTIIDFTGATNKFYDEDWDGPSLEDLDVEPKPKKTYNPPPKSGEADDPPGDYVPKQKLVVKLDEERRIEVIDIETRYVDPETGKPLSSKEFLRKMVDNLESLYTSEEELRHIWSNPETREELLQKLSELGLQNEQLKDMKRIIHGENCDLFDVLAYISFSAKMLTREQRVDTVEANDQFFNVYTNLTAKDFLLFVLSRYEKDGIIELRRDRLGELIKLKDLGSPGEAAAHFGGIMQMKQAYYDLQKEIYKVS